MNIHLLKAVRSVSCVDSSPYRIAVFDDIRSHSPLIATISDFYEKVKNSPLATIMIAVYGAKSFFSPVIARSQNSIIGAGCLPNEEKQLRYVQELLGEQKLLALVQFQLGSRSLLACANIRKTANLLKYLSIINRLKSKVSFMPLCRIASTLCFYFRFKAELEKRRPAAVLVASNYSPHAAALLSAARSLQIRSILIPHACVTDKVRFPGIFSTLTILDGPAALDAFQKLGKVEGKVIYRGLPGESQPMEVRDLRPGVATVGIFLTALTDLAILRQTLEKIKKECNPKKILLRPHPVLLVAPNLAELTAESGISISKGRSIAQDIEECDLVIIGNSSAHLEVLSSGKPTIYLPGLDSLPDDYYNFCSTRVVFRYSLTNAIRVEAIREFYSNDWPERFRYYDASYLKSRREFDKSVREAVLEVVAPSCSEVSQEDR
jgi:hypothetical protein